MYRREERFKRRWEVSFEFNGKLSLNYFSLKASFSLFSQSTFFAIGMQECQCLIGTDFYLASPLCILSPLYIFKINPIICFVAYLSRCVEFWRKLFRNGFMLYERFASKIVNLLKKICFLYFVVAAV